MTGEEECWRRLLINTVRRIDCESRHARRTITGVVKYNSPIMILLIGH